MNRSGSATKSIPPGIFLRNIPKGFWGFRVKNPYPAKVKISLENKDIFRIARKVIFDKTKFHANVCVNLIDFSIFCEP
jgi:hypothetical protein